MIVPLPAPLSELLHREFLSNSLQAWLTATITTVVLFLVLYFGRNLTVSRLGVLAARTTNYYDDMVVEVIAHTRKWVMLAMSVIVGFGALELPHVGQFFAPAAKLILLWQIAVWGGAAIGFWVKHHLEKRTSVAERGGVAMINAMGIAAKVVLWILIIITAFHSVLAINVTPWITGLGVSGIAVALAVQNILGDLLAALAIVFDKPFDVGDSIGVDQITGTVEHIGLKTTRIRSVTGEQIIIGNGDLLKSRLRNFRRMYQRRALFNVDVPFNTPADVLSRLPSTIKSIVNAQKKVRFERSHVASFGESAVRIETVYYVLDPDYNLYMDIQQAINLEIFKRFSGDNVRFAMPSRTVYHEGPLAKEVQVTPQLPATD
jgi:small-conductance mechanosensitive channel